MALVMLLLGYPLSFGPALWLVDLQCIPERPVALAYWLLSVCIVRLPLSIGEMFAAYGRAFAPVDKGVPACSRLLTRAVPFHVVVSFRLWEARQPAP
jgi:hypothetical protein